MNPSQSVETLQHELHNLRQHYAKLEATVQQREQQMVALAEERDRLLRFFNLHHDLFCIVNQEGYLVQINPAWEATLGYSIAELSAKPFLEFFLEFVHPDDLTDSIQAMSCLLEGKGLTKFTNRYLCKDGSYRWLNWTTLPSVTNQSTYAIAQDITHQKQAELATAISEAHLRRHSYALHELVQTEIMEQADLTTTLQPIAEITSQSLDIAYVSIWLYSGDRSTIDCVERFDKLQGCHSSRQTLASQPLPGYFDALQTEPKIVAHNALTDAHTQEFSESYLIPNNIGAVLVIPIWLKGEKIGLICCEQVDTPRHWLHEDENFVAAIADFIRLVIEVSDNKRVKSSLKEQEQFLRTVFDGCENLIFVVDVLADQDFRYVGWNKVTERFIGVQSTAVVGKTPIDFFGLEVGQRIFQKYQHCVDTKTSITYEECLTLQGKKQWFLTTLNPLTDENGTIYRLIGASVDTTERRQAEDSLLLYKQALDSISDAVGIADPEGNYFYQNRAFSEMFEYKTSEELMAAGGFAATLKDQARAAQILQAVAHTHTWKGEVEQQSKSGRRIYNFLRINPILDDENRTVGMIAAHTDITERKRTERALRQQMEMLDLASDAIIIRDMNDCVLYWNQGAEELYGWKKTEVKGHATQALLRTAFPKPLNKIILDCYRNGKWEGELVHLTRDRRQIVVQSRWTLQRDGTGNPTAFLEINTDITEQKLAEEALRQSEAQISRKAQREQVLNQLSSQIRSSLELSQILETSVQATQKLLQVDCCHFTLYCSEDAENPYWQIVNEAKNPDAPGLVGRRVAPHEIAPISNKILNRQILWIDDATLESDLTMKQLVQAFGFLSVLSIPIHTQSGKIGALFCGHSSSARAWQTDEVELLRAVTDQIAIAIEQADLYQQSRDRAQELETLLVELQRTQTQLVQSEKMSSLGQLVAGIAHEINNPVNFIYGNLTHAKGYTQDLLGLLRLYQAQYPDPTPVIQQEADAIDIDFLIDDLPKLMNSMKVGAERIQKIVLSLRNFSRMDEAEFKTVDVHEGIDSTLMILQNRLKARNDHSGIQIIKHYGQIPEIECFPGQLNQVFMNILVNALDALEERDQNRTLEEIKQNPSMIEIRTELEDSNNLCIYIRDNGPGIPADVQRRLFDPFFTTKTVGKGTGLGMSISYQIVTEKHGGSLQCFSTPGQGAEFAIMIPTRQRLKLTD